MPRESEAQNELPCSALAQVPFHAITHGRPDDHTDTEDLGDWELPDKLVDLG